MRELKIELAMALIGLILALALVWALGPSMWKGAIRAVYMEVQRLEDEQCRADTNQGE